jgi:hypothetical protein
MTSSGLAPVRHESRSMTEAEGGQNAHRATVQRCIGNGSRQGCVAVTGFILRCSTRGSAQRSGRRSQSRQRRSRQGRLSRLKETRGTKIKFETQIPNLRSQISSFQVHAFD